MEFGPVVSVMPFDDESDAAQIAHDSECGLVVGVWTTNLMRAHRITTQLQVGPVFLNEYFADGVETPFGGDKSSGLGREKGIEALLH